MCFSVLEVVIPKWCKDCFSVLEVVIHQIVEAMDPRCDLPHLRAITLGRFLDV